MFDILACPQMKNCQLFQNMPFTTVQIFNDFSTHTTPTLNMAKNTAAVALFLSNPIRGEDDLVSQYLGFPTFATKLPIKKSSACILLSEAQFCISPSQRIPNT